MALKSVRYEEVETYKACPESLRNRIVKNLLLEVTRKGMQPADLFQAEAQVLSVCVVM